MDTNKIFADSIPLRLFSQKLKPRIRTFKYKAPGMYLVGATTNIKEAEFKVNNTLFIVKTIKGHCQQTDPFSFLQTSLPGLMTKGQ